MAQGRNWGLVLTLAVLLALSSPAFSKYPKHIPRFAFDRDESPINIPLVLNVILVNFGPDAEPPAFRIEKDQFERLLFQLKQDHQPSCAETGEKLHVSFEMYYDVVHVSASDARVLAAAIARSMKPTADVQHMDTQTGKSSSSSSNPEKKVPVYNVHVEGELEKQFDKIYKTYVGNNKQYGIELPADGRGMYGLFVLNMDKSQMMPSIEADRVAATDPNAPLSYIYRYLMGSGKSHSGSDSWVAKGRYAVVDLSAGPSQFGNTQAGEGTVITASIPRKYYKTWYPTEEELNGGRSLQKSRSYKFQSQLSNIIFSSVQHVFAPDIQFDALDFSEKVLVPLIVFRDHQMYNPLEPGHDFSIDVDAIKAALQSLALPGQEVELVTGLQSLLEHERIAIAHNKASKSDTVHESHRGRYVVKSKYYLDSKTLFQELRETSDYLASGLISASPVLSQAFFPDFESEKDLQAKQKSGKWALGTRVLPVFVFSMMQEGEPQLFDNWQPFAASKDCILVLQSGYDDAPMPFFTGQKQMITSLKNPTPHIIAGIGSALGGIMPPHSHYSQVHQKETASYLWAHGFGPFGPFGNSSGFSQIAIDQVLSNSYVSRMDAAIDRVGDVLLKMDKFADTYLFDPLGEGVEAKKNLGWLEGLKRREAEEGGALPLSYETVRKLHDDVLSLEDLFSNGAEAMYHLDTAKTHVLSDEIFAKASAFHSHALKSLDSAYLALDCCGVQHQVVPRTRWSFIARAILVGLIACCVVAIAALLNPSVRKKRTKPLVH